MAQTFDELVDAASQLDEAQQVVLVSRLLGKSEELSVAWGEEVDHRLDLLENGGVEAKPLSDLEKHL